MAKTYVRFNSIRWSEVNVYVGDSIKGIGNKFLSEKKENCDRFHLFETLCI